MLWIIFALVGLVCFGLKNFFEKITVKKLEPATSAIIIRSVAFIQILCFFIVYLLFTGKSVSLNEGIIYAFLAGLAMASGTLATYKALKVMKLTLVIPVINLAGIVASILGVIFLKESINIYWIFGFIIALNALILIGWKQGGEMAFTPFVAMFGFGLMSFFNKLALGFLFPFEAFFFVFLFAMGFYLIFWKIKHKPSLKLKDKRDLFKASLAGTFLALGTVFFFIALSIGQLSRVVMIVDMNLAFTVLLGFIVLKEKVSTPKLIGIILSIIAIIILSLS